MLGAEPELIERFVDTGRLKLIFWPVLNHTPSLDVTAAAYCIGEQGGDLFWQAHDFFFQRQRELWQAERDYFVEAAVDLGADQARFEACYDGGEAHERVLALDRIRQERGIYSQPIFAINGRLIYGPQSLETFAQYIDAADP